MEKEVVERIKDSVNVLIGQISDKCQLWVKNGEDGLLRFVDPLDGEEISAHYGAIYAASAFIIYGERIEDSSLVSLGYRLMSSVLERWEISAKLPGFHNDFNNFALCVVWDYFDRTHRNHKLKELIKEIVISGKDSKNPTVNWIPMRWYVNQCRYQWTNDVKYKRACEKCRSDITSATFRDGFIEDRLPVGISFNLQYDLATVAGLQYLRSTGEHIDISAELGALLNIVAPDGDINYLGRGTNQCFAWGLWVYLLASSGKYDQLRIALDYLRDKVPVMLSNNNLMLNEWTGSEKYMWWDYHYCSVYAAHMLFWIVMAFEQIGSCPIKERLVSPRDSGIAVYKDRDYFVVTFAGRKEYLSERGPCVAVIWTKTAGMVVKGTFGPWQGMFGNRNSPAVAVISNACGLYKAERNIDIFKYRYLHKLLSDLDTPVTEKMIPIFSDIEVLAEDREIRIVWRTKEPGKKMLSVPCMDKEDLSVYVDGQAVRISNTIMIRNQYSWVRLYQTASIPGETWELRIRR